MKHKIKQLEKISRFGALATLTTLTTYLYGIKPGEDRGRRMKPFEETYIAHRGFFKNGTDHPENSMPAFRRAIARGFGIEMDVQMTTDGHLMVFHDENMKRMCGTNRKLWMSRFREVRQETLLNSGEHIPELQTVLNVIAGKVPLVLEIKPDGDWKKTAREVAKVMDQYHGIWCMESFHPLITAWFRFHRPYVLRGQLATNFFKDEENQPRIAQFALSNLLFNFLARPDFISYNHKYFNQFSYRLIRKLFPVENFAWTIHTPEELAQARKHFQVFIFDGFDPTKS
ncbi:glycerophosphodiester phosphodiesterase family protein [Oribacterium sp. HCP28S3_H8]|uniref:glycerophosphodiester phosphodiesterase family protein n=1 Tax=Oribacterium sp. HCP28S3_H8 TaxID=3438945 RepID=UPI003F8B8D77